MRAMFSSASSFNGDLSKWDVSSVTTMGGMFFAAPSFNGDIAKWDVSRVTDMSNMFKSASSFERTLCGKWATSMAQKDQMFDGSAGKLCTFARTTPTTTPTTTTT